MMMGKAKSSREIRDRLSANPNCCGSVDRPPSMAPPSEDARKAEQAAGQGVAINISLAAVAKGALSIGNDTHQPKLDRQLVNRGGKTPVIGQSCEFRLRCSVDKKSDTFLHCCVIDRHDGTAGDHKLLNGSNPHRENIAGLGRLLQPLIQKRYRAFSHQILEENTGRLTPADHAKDRKPGRLQSLHNKRLVRVRSRKTPSGAAVYGACSAWAGRVNRKIEGQGQLDGIICKKDLAI